MRVCRKSAANDHALIKRETAPLVSRVTAISASWHQRDKEEFGDLLRRTIEIHARLHREWPRLAREYRAALPDITSPEQWAKTFEADASRS